jgi:hypothetical protein
MTNKKQLDESKLMAKIENLVKSFKDYIESHNETFGTSESKVIDGLRDALDIVIRGDSDDKSLLIAEHEGYRTYARIVWGMEAFDITFYLVEDTILGGVVVGSNHYVIQKSDICN